MAGSNQLSEKYHEFIYNWNDPMKKDLPFPELNDESLRDGVQSPSVHEPPLELKLKFIERMIALKIDAADIGFPGAHDKMFNDCVAIGKYIRENNLPLSPNCAARTSINDIKPIIDVAAKAEIELEAAIFVGSSQIRQFIENWDQEYLINLTEKAVTYAIDNGLSCFFVTEDTTRANPDFLEKLYLTAIEAGASRVCISDTVGYSTPSGVRKIVSFMRNLIRETKEEVKLDWHGHNDRGLGLVNALVAADSGVDRIHGTALGIGERSGNTPMDLLIVNLFLEGFKYEGDTQAIIPYCKHAAKMFGIKIPHSYPVAGIDAFRTATGVHANAVIKARKHKDEWLANLIYSGVPAHIFGRDQTIEVGPVSGQSNVVYWLERHGYDGSDTGLVEHICSLAKNRRRIFTNEEIRLVVINYKKSNEQK
jgi:2-isopropylmalate synthase